MKNIIYIFIALFAFVACSETAEEIREREAAERRQLEIEDSLAFKVAVMPTIECLPFFIMKEYGLVDSTVLDFRLKHFMAQMDCDTALERGRAELAVSDVVRVERMKSRGVAVDYLSSTDAQWVLIGNHRKGIDNLDSMTSKMMSMTRFSATDMLSTMAMDSAKLTSDQTFKVQINDVRIRLQMLRNNEMDALWLPEPFATAALEDSNVVMMTTREKDLRLGVIAMSTDIKADSARKAQLAVVTTAYNAACDTINKKGIEHFSEMIGRLCYANGDVVKRMPKDIRFNHITTPRPKDIAVAKEWLDKQ